jgi:hypothetical protein
MNEFNWNGPMIRPMTPEEFARMGRHEEIMATLAARTNLPTGAPQRDEAFWGIDNLEALMERLYRINRPAAPAPIGIKPGPTGPNSGTIELLDLARESVARLRRKEADIHAQSAQDVISVITG